MPHLVSGINSYFSFQSPCLWLAYSFYHIFSLCQLTTLTINKSLSLLLPAQNLPLSQIFPTLDSLPTVRPRDWLHWPYDWTVSSEHLGFLGDRKTIHPMLSGPCVSCLSVTLEYCGQTVGRIKMTLGMEVGLSPNHIVLDGDAAPPERGTAPLPTFWPFCLLSSNSRPSQQLLSSCLLVVFFIPLLFSFIGSVRHIKLAMSAFGCTWI